MKVALVTGATDGIGLETARQLAALGWRVLVHGRNADRAGAVARRIEASASGAAVEPVVADFARMADVVALARDVAAKAPALDVLLNNAGVYMERRQLTPDGLETTMAVNHFAPVLLTHHLRAAVARAPQGRVVTVSSMAHSSGEIDVADLALARGYSGYQAYATSKLANVLFTVALARRVTGTRVTANCLHPGVISTKLLRAGFGMGGAAVEHGAHTSVYLATSPEVTGASGRYFVDCQAATPSRRGRDEGLAEALWEASERTLAAWW